MKIIVDAMGSDNAPEAEVMGAISAVKEFGVEVILVGRGEEILQTLKENGYDNLPMGVEIAHASEVVEMHDDPTGVLKEKKDSSMVVGLKLLAAGEGDAFVSAGNTGALTSGATLIVKRIRGIRRVAISSAIPTAKGKVLILDSGANAECTPEFLLQFGYMGSYYAESVMGIPQPRVALLNIGVEETKGTPLQKEAYKLLRAAGDAGQINFIGNVEARGVCLGETDVIVCDGFSGNILLKSIEGAAKFVSGKVKDIFYASAKNKLAGAMVKKDFDAMKASMDYKEVGGAPILGISKPVIKAHGSSDARAIRSAILQTKEFAVKDIAGLIADNIDLMKLKRDENTATAE